MVTSTSRTLSLLHTCARWVKLQTFVETLEHFVELIIYKLSLQRRTYYTIALHFKLSLAKLIEKRQDIMKDAWLTYTGHKRPEMNIGLPMVEAQQKNDELEKQIEELLKKSLQN